ncbi:MAG: hypothetical protein K8J31_24330 [Anaerolineae bacterium]|nr:hypothetical protein [Anaerolineae bacterium]
MKLTQIQIRLVQRSFGRAATKKRLVASLFYDRLMELDSTLRPMFKADMEEQGRKFLRMLALIVSHLDQPAELQRLIQTNHERHLRQGVKARREDYQTVCSAFIWALEHAFGKGFTPAMREAWQATFDFIADIATDPYATAC